LQGWIQKFKDAALGANIIGTFDCQGQPSGLAKFIIRFNPNPHFRASIQTSQGKPDAARLERARTFANEMVNKLNP
jgi:hypothetical protein